MTTDIDLYNALKSKIGEKEAESIIDFVNTKTNHLDEKSQKEFTTDDKVKMYISDAKTEIIRWMFVFWIGTIAPVCGVVFALFTAYLKK